MLAWAFLAGVVAGVVGLWGLIGSGRRAGSEVSEEWRREHLYTSGKEGD